jgi:anaerobic magnesium-protoporphyrin IX monomethyl ester cyclase
LIWTAATCFKIKNPLIHISKTIKLLDRSFNAKTAHALAILEFIFKHYRPGIQFQFEINGDVLDQRIIDYINDYAPRGLLRFEIGIQSTYEPTNEIVKRYQNFERLSEVIKQLQQNHKIDFHLDLIAGLPLENLERFARSFDDVFAFYPKELQLGFLKLLRGTSLRKEAEKYGYVYDENPPYELLYSNDLSPEDIGKIHLAEEMLEKFWNSGKMPITMNTVIRTVASPFYFFLDLGNYYLKQQFKMFKFQNDELFSYLDEYLNRQYQDLLIEDYLRLSKIKPKRWWKARLDKSEARETMHYLIEKYTSESLTKVEALLEKVESIIDDENAAQAEVDEMYDQLHQALDQLVIKEDVNTNDKVEGDVTVMPTPEKEIPKDDSTSAAKTGDSVSIQILAGTLLISILGIGILRKKKQS